MSILSKAPAQDAPAALSKRGTAPTALLSSAPRADLLPPEIGLANKRVAVRRGLRVVVVVVVVVAILGTAAAWQYSVAANASLQAAQRTTQQLDQQKAKYSDVLATINGISEGQAAEAVGGGTDIDWADYLSKLQATLPSGVTLKSVTVSSANATTVFVQSSVPLEGERIGTITFTADSPTIPSIPTWVNGLATLPGFADASPDSVTKQETGGYEAQVTMHINTGAYSKRFDLKKEGAK